MKMKKFKNMLLVTLGALFCVSAPVLAADSGNTTQEPGTTPAGYFEDSGYYNSYFGFKLELPAEENASMRKGTVFSCLALANEWDITLDEIDVESFDASLKELFDATIEDKGYAIVYDSWQGSVEKNGESFGVSISLEKAGDNVSEETYLSNLKDTLTEYALPDEEITSGNITFAGKERDFVARQSGETGIDRAYIILFSEEYICMIDLREFTTFETACDAFEEMSAEE